MHPPLGKWLIALGEWMFGLNSFGWRFMPLVFGTALVFVTIRLARRLSRSTLVGGLAGLLLAVDGLAFTMSRIALIDIFAAFFVVAAVSALAADRDWFRTRLADHLVRSGRPDLGGAFGPLVWWRPWRWVAGLMFGAAVSVKWNALFFLAVFGLLAVWWDVSARRLAGAGRASALALLADGIPAFFAMVVVAGLAHLSSWLGWVLTGEGWGRQWGAEHPEHLLVKLLGPDLAAWLHYQKEIYAFHTGDYIRNATHPYSASPSGWLHGPPTGFDAVNDIAPGPTAAWDPTTASASSAAWGRPCSGGSRPPPSWWASCGWYAGTGASAPARRRGGGMAALVPARRAADLLLLRHRVGPVHGRNPGDGAGPAAGPPDAPTRRVRSMAVGVVVALIVANFAWIYPVLTDQLLPYRSWLVRMWLSNWI